MWTQHVGAAEHLLGIGLLQGQELERIDIPSLGFLLNGHRKKMSERV